MIKKKLLLFLLLLLCSAGLQTMQAQQNRLYIYKIDGSKEVVLFSDLRGLHFSATEMQITLKNGETTTFDIADISFITLAEKPASASIEKEMQSKDVKIYPNPASNIVNIESSENISSIVLFDGQGKNVLQQRSINAGQTTLDISALSKGSYILQMLMVKETITKKIIKK